MLHSSLSTVEFCLQTQGFTFIVHSLYSAGPGFESLILVPIFVVSEYRYIVQAALSPLSAGITGMHHCTQLFCVYSCVNGYGVNSDIFGFIDSLKIVNKS